jgi:hypothetical protein
MEEARSLEALARTMEDPGLVGKLAEARRSAISQPEARAGLEFSAPKPPVHG